MRRIRSSAERRQESGSSSWIPVSLKVAIQKYIESDTEKQRYLRRQYFKRFSSQMLDIMQEEMMRLGKFRECEELILDRAAFQRELESRGDAGLPD
jgi:hypothetical protein